MKTHHGLYVFMRLGEKFLAFSCHIRMVLDYMVLGKLKEYKINLLIKTQWPSGAISTSSSSHESIPGNYHYIQSVNRWIRVCSELYSW